MPNTFPLDNDRFVVLKSVLCLASNKENKKKKQKVFSSVLAVFSLGFSRWCARITNATRHVHSRVPAVMEVSPRGFLNENFVFAKRGFSKPIPKLHERERIQHGGC